MNYLTLDQAKTFTGKSESTLRRLVKKKLGTKNRSEYVKTRKLKNGGYQYLVHKEWLRKKYNIQLEEVSQKEAVVEKPTQQKQVENPSQKIDVSVYEKYIKTLEKQLEVKDTQISEKDKQLNELIERDRENHLMLEKINDALIKFKIPEYIDAQLVTYSEEEKVNIPQEKPAEKKSEPKKVAPISKAKFSDWLSDLK